jgi:hypothetical protein
LAYFAHVFIFLVSVNSSSSHSFGNSAPTILNSQMDNKTASVNKS